MVGEGAAMASKRRQWGRMEEARMRREREAAELPVRAKKLF